MKFTTLQNVLWTAGLIGHVALLLVLLVTRRFRNFPVLTLWAAFHIAKTAALFTIARYGGPHAYFNGYWTLAAGDYLLQIALIVEIARHVFRPGGHWVHDAQRTFKLWSAAGFVIALALSLNLPLHETGRALWADRSWVFLSLIMCELFLALSSAANRLNLQWRDHVMALGQGLALWASFSLVSDLAQFITGWAKHQSIFDSLLGAVYLSTLIYWTFAFSRAERVREPISEIMHKHMSDLHGRVQYDLQTLNSVK